MLRRLDEFDLCQMVKETILKTMDQNPRTRDIIELVKHNQRAGGKRSRYCSKNMSKLAKRMTRLSEAENSETCKYYHSPGGGLKRWHGALLQDLQSVLMTLLLGLSNEQDIYHSMSCLFCYGVHRHIVPTTIHCYFFQGATHKECTIPRQRMG